MMWKQAIFLTLCLAQTALAKEKTQPVVKLAVYKIDTAKSKVNWVGKKSFVEGYNHHGTIDISGEVSCEGDIAKAADIAINMLSIKNLDITKKEDNAKLIGHLESKDFFDVHGSEANKTAHLKIESIDVAKKMANGQLTIRGVTKPIQITLTKVTVKDGIAEAEGSAMFNRRDYGVNYSSVEDGMLDKAVGLAKDKIIDNNIAITFTVHAVKVQAAQAKK